MKTIFIAGAGTMGLEIAFLHARNGFAVTIRDISPEILAAARSRLDKMISGLLAKGRMDASQAETALENLFFTTDLAQAAEADLVLEAIVENLPAKQELFSALEKICPLETIFATNTSSISITQISQACRRREKVIGMHFFNPPGVMKLVEIIRGVHTDQATVDAVRGLAAALGKEAVEVAESPGFIVNRLLIPMINDAANLLQENVASAQDIDMAMKLGANHPMGPLALGDLIGLDVCLAIMQTIFSETGDMRYRPSLLLVKMVRGGKLGRKAGEGFFKY